MLLMVLGSILFRLGMALPSRRYKAFALKSNWSPIIILNFRDVSALSLPVFRACNGEPSFIENETLETVSLAFFSFTRSKLIGRVYLTLTGTPFWSPGCHFGDFFK